MAKNFNTPVHRMLNSNEMDSFRAALNRLARVALPMMSVGDIYLSDLTYDAATMCSLDVGESYFLLVRDVGTNSTESVGSAVQMCDEYGMGGRAVLRITRGRYDTFQIDVAHRFEGA